MNKLVGRVTQMNTHATARKQWTEDALNGLAVEQDFRLRGLEVTRLDTFIDAAFAFVLTLLVISFDEIPSNIDEMLDALKRIPAFAVSFATLMMFWLQHRRWSRRYGLENSKTVLLSLALIFVVMVYVYPLRMVFEGMFNSLSDGFFTSSYQIDNYRDLRGMFVVYSVGFAAMSLILSQLFRAALYNREFLALNSVEQQITKTSMHIWMIAAGFGVLSIMIALFISDPWISVAGYMYFSLIPALSIFSRFERRSLARLQAGT
jgi:uncharacterized membrane protein